MVKNEKTKKVEKKTKRSSAPKAPHKLSTIVVVVERRKSDYYIDVLLDNEVNITLTTMGMGTVKQKIVGDIGASESEKAVIFGVVRQDKIKPLFELLEEKFSTVRGGKGVAFAIPMSSVIGVSSYKFLANKEK